MNTRRIAAASLAAALCAAAAPSAEALTGNDWKNLPADSREAYVWGVADTWSAVRSLNKAPPVAEKPDRPTRMMIELAECVSRGMTYGQISAIVEKYMIDNPGTWHSSMAYIIWIAVLKACS